MRWRHRFPCSTRLPEDGRRNSATHCDALQGTCWVESWVFRPFGGRLVMAFHGHPSRDSYGRRRQVAVALRESPCPSSRSAAGPRRWGMVSRAMVASGPRQGRITGSGTPQLSSFPLQLCLRIKRSFNPQPRTPSATAPRPPSPRRPRRRFNPQPRTPSAAASCRTTPGPSRARFNPQPRTPSAAARYRNERRPATWDVSTHSRGRPRLLPGVSGATLTGCTGGFNPQPRTPSAAA